MTYEEVKTTIENEYQRKIKSRVSVGWREHEAERFAYQFVSGMAKAFRIAGFITDSQACDILLEI